MTPDFEHRTISKIEGDLAALHSDMVSKTGFGFRPTRHLQQGGELHRLCGTKSISCDLKEGRLSERE